MDTSGLTTLVAAYIAVRKQQGRIVLVNPSGRVRELLRVTRLETLLEVFDSVDGAIISLAQESQTQS
jgi:anti-anti-sigma factor